MEKAEIFDLEHVDGVPEPFVEMSSKAVMDNIACYLMRRRQIEEETDRMLTEMELQFTTAFG